MSYGTSSPPPYQVHCICSVQFLCKGIYLVKVLGMLQLFLLDTWCLATNNMLILYLSFFRAEFSVDKNRVHAHCALFWLGLKI